MESAMELSASEVEPSTQHSQFVASVNWSATALGLRTTWPHQLNYMVDLIMADPTPAAIMWGDALTMVYNEAFVEFAGSKHPTLMGSTPMVAYAEVWDSMFAGIIAHGRKTGRATRHKDVRLFLNRHEYTEECYVTYTFVPILGPEKTVVGFYHTAVETTGRVLSERRTRTLLEIGEKVTAATCLDQYWDGVLKAFESSSEDVPFAVAYSFRDLNDARSLSSGSESGSSFYTDIRVPLSCTLAGVMGRSIGQVPLSFDIHDEQDVFVQVVRNSVRSYTMTKLDSSMNMPDWVFQYENTKAFGDPCTSALVVPIRMTSAKDSDGKDALNRNAVGFLLLGLNPRKAYDDIFEKHARLWKTQLSASAASVVLLEQEIQRQRRLAVQLLVSKKVAQESEIKFSRFAEMSNVAMWIMDPNGRPLYTNKAWREQTRGDVETLEPAAWIDVVSERSRAVFEDSWASLIEEKVPVSFECELRPYGATSESTIRPSQNNRWVLCSAYPELTDDGEVAAIWGCNTDISHQKWVESLKEQRLLDVLEAKRQTENFIDMTSHEMRNPLSAILHCADGINDGIKEAATSAPIILSDVTAKSIAEYAQIIVLCAQHQKRIVDDILTVSKLDASLLVVAPVEADPIKTVQHALKLHHQELHISQIKCHLDVDSSYHDLNIQRVYMDSSRILQILMNLITNAIKFTQNQPERSISLHLGASIESPGAGTTETEYFPPKDPHSLEIGAASDVVFLTFSVQDTGCGLTDAEMQRLFVRFSQASPKTHAEYGGSGLGLFICKELTELQGGRIGVSSTPGQGSNFKFYVKARRFESTHHQTQKDVRIEQSQAGIENDSPVLDLSGLSVQEGVREKGQILPTSKIGESGINIDKLHVLVVEDNLINQRVVASRLIKAGCVVHTADNGAEALVFLQKTTYAKASGPNAIPLSIVLLDLEMPVMDGLTCVAQIRRWQDSKDLIGAVPVLAITANARGEQVEKALAHGMDDVITKPFNISDLMPKMRSLIGKASA